MTHARRIWAVTLTVLGAASIGLIVNSPTSGGQTLTCLGADATVNGDPDGDGVVAGTPEGDVILGTEGDDTINAGGGDDRICGLGGNDTIKGEDGYDRTDGGAGDDNCDTERALRCEQVTGADPKPAPKAPKGGSSSSSTSSTR
jgi:Ca2+-binding RTX toxin-like protein